MSFLSFVHPPMLDCAVLSHFSRIRLFVTLWTVARQAPLSIGFSRQEYCSGLPCPPPWDLFNQRLNPSPLGLLHWRTGPLPVAPPGKPYARLILKFPFHINKDE